MNGERTHSVLIRAFAVLCFLLAAGALPAQRGADLLGFDAPTAARAGVDLAIAEEVSAVATNPAGLVRLPTEWRIDLTARLFLPEYRYEDALNPGGESYDDPELAPSFGVAWDPVAGDTGEAGDWRLAFGVHHRSAFKNALDVVTQDYPAPDGTPRKTDYLETAADFGVAYRISKELSVGLTLSIVYSKLSAREPFELPTSKFQGQSPLGIAWGTLLANQFNIQNVRIDGDLESDALFGFSSTLGFLWEPTDVLSVGFAYRTPRFSPDYSADVDVDISRIFGEPDPVTFPDGFRVHYDGTVSDFSYPQSAALGLAWRPIPEIRLATDLRWTDWSATHDRLSIRLRNGDNPGFNAFVGSSSLDLVENLGFRDQLAIGLSLEVWIAESWIVRSGFVVATNPVDDRFANPLAPAFTELSTGLGLGYVADRWSVDLAWVHSFENEVSPNVSAVSSDLSGSTQSFAVDSVLLTFSIFF